MPAPFVRHARSKSDWGTQPQRSAERREAASEPAKRPPGRKDRWARCKGNHGGPHEMAITPHPGRYTGHPARCCWRPAWNHREGIHAAAWSCRHHEACIHCGKEARSFVSRDECPDYPGTGGQRAAAEAQGAEWDEHRAALDTRRPVITGPQGYRRRSKERA